MLASIIQEKPAGFGGLLLSVNDGSQRAFCRDFRAAYPARRGRVLLFGERQRRDLEAFLAGLLGGAPLALEFLLARQGGGEFFLFSPPALLGFASELLLLLPFLFGLASKPRIVRWLCARLHVPPPADRRVRGGTSAFR